MLLQYFTFLAAAAAVALGVTPSGFEPSTQNSLVVSYNGIDATGGKRVGKEASSNAPQLGTKEKMTGTSFAVMMVDIDIPTPSPPQTNTLLHWMQTGLTLSQTATSLNTTGGTASVFALEMPAAVQAAAPYFGPNPPARMPLDHRYVQVLIDTSGASQEAMAALMQAAQTRMGFSAKTVLEQVGLQDKVVAGNFFMVTNPGPAQDATNAGIASGSQAASHTGAAASQRASGVLLGFALVCAIFSSLQ